MSTMLTKLFTPSALVALAFVAFGASPANAGSINYGDFVGTTVIYLDVTETANTPGDVEPLFGPPTIIGDKLDFDPAGFSATATSGSADITDAQLNFILMGLPSFRNDNLVNAISSFTVSEGGDYSLLGIGTAATQISYGLSISSVLVLEVDGVALATPISLGSANTFGSDDLSGGPETLSPWSLALNYDVTAALLAAQVAFEYGATKLEIVIDDSLVAISEASTVAFIAKKDFMIDVPEPSTAALLGLALGGLGLASRRRS